MTAATKNQAFWSATGPQTGFPRLTGQVEADVAVVGGGMVGITAALLLQQAGKRVVVVEADRVGRGVTGGTTGKLTSQHGLIYDRLIRDVGEERARLYGEANQQALARMAGWVDQFGLECDFERKPNYIVTRQQEDVEALRREVEAAQRLGLPASFTRDVPVPFESFGAVRFEDQAQFHAVKYLVPLAERVAAGGFVFEQSRVKSVEQGEPCMVTTDDGSVRARDVIVASNLPVIPQGEFFAKAYPQAHLGLAARVPADAAPKGMFLTHDEPTYSVRAHSGDGGPWVIFQGPRFKPGHHADTEQGYREVEAFAKANFPIEEIAYRWCNEDYTPADGVPFIGRASKFTDRLYVATGFNAWGLTTSTVAALLITDMILGRDNPWLAVYDATRLKPLITGEFVKENVQVAKHWIKGRFADAEKIRPGDLTPGDAAIIEQDGGKVAAYCDEKGTVHAVSAVCTHMGCVLGWNPAEKSWDCACHGSRFGHDGSILHGPAVMPLARTSVR